MKWPVYKAPILSPDGNRHDKPQQCFAVLTRQIDGQVYTWFARQDGQLGGLVPRQTRAGSNNDMLAAPTGDQLGEAELRVILHRRESPRDEELARSILGIGDRTTRVLERLETLFLAALRDESGLEYDAEAQIATLPTAPHQAAEWLFGFYRQTRLSPTNPPMGFSPPVSRFSYSINADEFGETLHVFACRELLRSYRPPGNETRNKPELAWTRSGGAHDAVRRFDDLLGAGSSAAGNGPGSPRGDINRYLLAPMLVRDPLAGHATILRGLLSSNHAKIATAVDGELGTQSPAAQSVGIWIRASTSNPTTNTTAERLNQIVGAIPHHGDGIMLLGDPVAPGALQVAGERPGALVPLPRALLYRRQQVGRHGPGGVRVHPLDPDLARCGTVGVAAALPAAGVHVAVLAVLAHPRWLDRQCAHGRADQRDHRRARHKA